jgi:hypothetical protein
MKGDVLRVKRDMEKFDMIHFQEYIKIGHHDMKIQMVSDDKPRILILATESKIEDISQFMKVTP